MGSGSRQLPSLEEVNPLDIAEVGERAAFGLWGENSGLIWAQRLVTITQRRPAGRTWQLNYGPDGTCTSMSWPAWDGKGLW
jgi:hypothetical protein